MLLRRLRRLDVWVSCCPKSSRFGEVSPLRRVWDLSGFVVCRLRWHLVWRVHWRLGFDSESSMALAPPRPCCSLLILFRPRLSLRFSLGPSRLCFLALVMFRFASRSVSWFLGTVLVRAAPSLRGVFGVGGGSGFPWLNSSSQHWSRSPAFCL